LVFDPEGSDRRAGFSTGVMGKATEEKRRATSRLKEKLSFFIWSSPKKLPMYELAFAPKTMAVLYLSPFVPLSISC
jgi:hypothetical protein